MTFAKAIQQVLGGARVRRNGWHEGWSMGFSGDNDRLVTFFPCGCADASDDGMELDREDLEAADWKVIP